MAATELPRIVADTIEYLRDEQYASEYGLFRQSANAKEMRRLKDAYDARRNVVLAEEGVDVHVVAGLLKIFFRELSEPAFPRNLVEHFRRIGAALALPPPPPHAPAKTWVAVHGVPCGKRRYADDDDATSSSANTSPATRK
mmetsp:Transcript_11724/g.28584  ORF Transcript_11724/g.28584 Transcript_11724/m.28584 type:complete len:141 (-) Transcript_11724:44-466(-)